MGVASRKELAHQRCLPIQWPDTVDGKPFSDLPRYWARGRWGTSGQLSGVGTGRLGFEYRGAGKQRPVRGAERVRKECVS